MARKREQYPQLRFRSSLSRLGLGIKPPQGHAHSTTTTNPAQKGEYGEEEEWYIPYNGPYEPPPSNEPRSAPAYTSRRKRREDGVEFREVVKAGESSVRGSGEDTGLQSRYTSSEDGLGSIFGRDNHQHLRTQQHSMMPDFGETDVEEDESEEIVRGDMDLRARYGYSYASSNDEETDFNTPLPSATHPVLPLSAPPVSTQGWSSSEDKGLRPRAISSTSRPAATISSTTRRATVSSGHGGIGEAPVPALRTSSSQNSKPGVAANPANPLSLFHLNYSHHHRDTDTTDSITSASPPTQYSIFTASPPQTYSVISSPPGTGHGTVNEAFGRFSRDTNSVMGRDGAVGNPRLSLASLFSGSLGFKGKGKEREGKVPGDQRLKVKSSKSDLARNDVRDAYRVQVRPLATQYDGDVIYIGDEKNMPGADLDASDNDIVSSSVGKDARTDTGNSLASTNAADNKSGVGTDNIPSDGDNVDADSEAYYNTYYATLLSTPTSARGSSFRSSTPGTQPGGSASDPIPPLPLHSSSNVLPLSQFQVASPSTGRISPRVDMGGFGRRHGKNREKENIGEEDVWKPSPSSRAAEVIRSEAEADDEGRRGRPAGSRSRQPVHPYANVRAFTFPSSPGETSRVDETDLTGSTSRPPKLTFTAPSQHSSPLSGPHTHPTAHLHLQTHPHLLPPPPHSDSSQPHSHSDSQESYSPRSLRRPVSPQSKPNSPSQTQSPSRALLLPHPLQHLHNIRNRLKLSMSTPNLRASGSSASGSLSGQSSRSSAASTNQKLPHTRNPSKSKAPEDTRHVPRPINIIKQKSVPNSPHHAFPRGLDRWLSAETWCDALFLPKPRLRLRGDDPYYEKGESIVGPSSGSRRIVSPPGSPVARDFVNRADGSQTLESRVLAHSRSLADLRLGHQESVIADRKGKERMTGRPATADVSGSRARGLTLPSSSARPATANPITGTKVETSHPMPAPAVVIIKPNTKPSRPKSWALDDLALPSPVPSLMTVLAEGQILEHQRRKWQAQAQKSFQNQRSRSLSRSRSKSVSKKVKGNDAKGQSSHGKDSKLEYLAARSLLGNQDILPISTGIRKRSLSQSHTATDSTGRPSGGSQSTAHRPSHSFSQTMSKSTHSRTGSQNHSRNGSWSKTALDKIAMGTAALCGIPGGDSTTATPETEHPPAVGLERALRSDTTQVIRLADPATVLPHPSASPTPSYGFTNSSHGHGTAESGPVEGVGIAISTPGSDLDRDSIRLRDHPYAQTVPNVYHHTYVPPAPPANLSDQRYVTKRASDAHSGAPDSLQIGSRHPFAQQRDSYQGSPKIIGHPRPDSEVSPQATMWAPVAAGVVREVLPEEIRYSPIVNSETLVRGTSNDAPDTDPRIRQLGKFARNSRNIFDTVALGETLAMAVEDSRDHLSRISEGYSVSNEDEGERSFSEGSHQPDPRIVASTGSQSPRETHREPVQYDASRPMHRQASLQIPEVLETSLQASSSQTDALPEPESRRSQISRDTSESSTGSMLPTSPIVTSPITSESSSPRPSPRLLSRNSDDLEHFRDLFYRPDTGRQQSFQSGMSAAQSSSAYTGHVSWDANIAPSRHRTASSGLTSLVRRVGEELEELNMLVAEMGMELGDDSSSILSASSRPTESRFVLEPSQGIADNGDHVRMQAFRPSTTIPEDVEGSAEGEQLMDDGEEDEDADLTARFRIGIVEAVPTPPSTSEDRRFSQHLSSYITHPGSSAQPNAEEATVRVVSNASLQPPSTVLSRVSYMTSSDGSRMSGLSDFPVPPLQDQMTPGNMSIVDSYFEDVTLRQEFALQTPMSRQSTLGGDEEVDFAMAFSSRPHTARPQS
ncbi:hypothetical protein PC9H_008361 [Pleurotus ostreatus]|uniref:Uncharacterized protein n=1 Tax=Pleurotus ostreatus TaxID=5322 RepID=A0A8H7DNW3_PLEOS|nr:uncharacterized protein PC9H_008361 [Pleurotus ostreatus]KAF7425999.1 hypothetical protein PC9H_008361 [Pleurotus ostreatus]KAJ8693410.1 hypothetical protein PTI98_008404 [Pleurotus ostreatus]